MPSMTLLLAISVATALALALYMRVLTGRIDVARHVEVDDWRGARDAAEAIVTAGRAHPRVVDHAAVVLVMALEVLGDHHAARRAVAIAEQRDLPPALRALLERQVASLDRMAGDVDAALRRLTGPEATAGGDEWALDTNLALLHLSTGDAAAAEGSASSAVARLDRLLSGAVTSALRQAYEADLAQAMTLVVRARLLQGDVEGAAAAWSRCRGFAEKPYVQGQLAETAARLAWAQGDADDARRLAGHARARYERIGAQVDVARAAALQAGYTGDRAEVDAAEAELRRLGALGYLGEVRAARELIEAG